MAVQLYSIAFSITNTVQYSNPLALYFSSEMIQQSTWMEMIIGSFELWERVVIYGQFQPIDAGETDQERRKRRNNTFAKQPTEYTRNWEQRTAPPNNTSQS